MKVLKLLNKIKVLWIVGAMALTLSSCVAMDVFPDTDEIYENENFVTVMPMGRGDSCYYIYNGKTLYDRHAPIIHTDRQVRAFLRYNYSHWDTCDGYDFVINIISLDTITTKSVSPDLGQPENDEIYGNPIDSKYQWSVNAAAGIQYNIIDWLAVFAEPGVTYFLNNESLYGEHPWNFNARIGLRFNITSR